MLLGQFLSAEQQKATDDAWIAASSTTAVIDVRDSDSEDEEEEGGEETDLISSFELATAAAPIDYTVPADRDTGAESTKMNRPWPELPVTPLSLLCDTLKPWTSPSAVAREELISHLFQKGNSTTSTFAAVAERLCDESTIRQRGTAFYENESWSADNSCPICKVAESKLGDRAKHVHACVGDDLTKRLLKEATEQLSLRCSWKHINRAHESPASTIEEASQRLMGHLKSERHNKSGHQPLCRVLTSQGVICGEHLGDAEDSIRHLALTHGLLAMYKSASVLSKNYVLYCTLCRTWQIGPRHMELHARHHIDMELSWYQNTADSCATDVHGKTLKLGTFDGHPVSALDTAKCPWCLFDNAAPATIRFQSFAQFELLKVHLKRHLDSIFNDAACPWTECGLRLSNSTELKEHLVTFHNITVLKTELRRRGDGKENRRPE
ncbi:hypothetical protein HDU90_008130 [Geranomyces variabilis]|nr:hypothetical protein HDU90_008130 [Geranomyces variabilis]